MVHVSIRQQDRPLHEYKKSLLISMRPQGRLDSGDRAQEKVHSHILKKDRSKQLFAARVLIPHAKLWVNDATRVAILFLFQEKFFQIVLLAIPPKDTAPTTEW